MKQLFTQNLLSNDSIYLKKNITLINQYFFCGFILYVFLAITEYFLGTKTEYFFLAIFCSIFYFSLMFFRILVNIRFLFILSLLDILNLCSVVVIYGIHPFFMVYAIISLLNAPLYYSTFKNKNILFIVLSIQFFVILFSFIFADINNIYVKLDFFYDLANEIIAIWFLILTLFFVYLKLNLNNKRILKFHDNKSKKDTALKEIIQAAKENRPEFLVLFTNYYSDFEKQLFKKKSELSLNDLRYCAMIFLDFSTKEIATNMNVSLRTVENKKYTLRKILNIEENVKLKDFLKSI